jgi:hypothetical protein
MDPTGLFDVPRYCESPVLSIQHPGKEYKGLQVDMAKIPIMKNEELQNLIDAAALIFDFSKIGKGMGEGAKKLTNPELRAQARMVDKSHNMKKKAELIRGMREKKRS